MDPLQQPTEKHEEAFPVRVVEGCGLRLELGRRTLVMGILNVTPDSFADGGKFLSPDSAIEHAERMTEKGADLIDVGGESSRPGSDSISEEEEIRRVIPVIERIAKHINIPVSVDTYRPGVARAALSAGAKMINDIKALRHDPEMTKVIAEAGAPVVLMHMQGTPKTMQEHPSYYSVVDEITHFFHERLKYAQAFGIKENQIILDPGIGFGKTTQQNLSILRSLHRFESLSRPLLIGVSRKSVIGQVLNLPVEERLEGTAAAVCASVLGGASIVRVHDVGSMVRVVRMADAIKFGVAGVA